ncbi:hypothetical protein B0J12DRAFT_660084 [Macrophomina phaseolina]|uniref:Serine-threonine/tyrosine-protein kinase catalytic domain-containing protein n=1 Tax=Macrophomina phaseolina TaxID=35725 RepID=A0ABQ8GEW1_9PEZI|nr:hypothetical protein B0J12DRAFT_660084 [Macrophomina phaseolina]
MYNIRFGQRPFSELEPPERVRKMISGEFPSTFKDREFGEIMTRCWNGEYDSIKSLRDHVLSQSVEYIDESVGHSSQADGRVMELLTECETFLSQENAHKGTPLPSCPINPCLDADTLRVRKSKS